MNYHFVWPTKYRRKVLVEKIAEDLYELHDLIARKEGITLITQEILPDHVHLFITAHLKFAPANLIKIFKGLAAKKLFEKHPEITNTLANGHLWNPSYYVGTFGDTTKDVVRMCIETQKVK